MTVGLHCVTTSVYVDNTSKIEYIASLTRHDTMKNNELLATGVKATLRSSDGV